MSGVHLRRTLRRVLRPPIAAAAGAVLTVPLLAGAMPPPPHARTIPYHGKIWSPFPLRSQRPVPGHPLSEAAGAAARAAAASARLPRGAARALAYRPAGVGTWWPAAASGVTRLSPNAAPIPGGLPVQLSAAGGRHAGAAAETRADVRVTVAGHAAAVAAGIHGVIMTVSRAGGAGATAEVSLGLKYGRMVDNYGGAWASRLRLVELPACALTSPAQAACRTQVPLRSSNDAAAQVVSATIGLPAGNAPQPGAATGGQVVIAATSTPSGPEGDYTATSLKPSGTWVAQQGDFTYSYPITVPPALGGKAPDVSLSYDSQSMDSETSGTNTQASWIGDGWDYSPGFIERSYTPCTNDGIPDSGDECWGGYNATLSLGGRSGVLVRDSAGGWHLQNDDGTTVQLETGASNGLWQGEYWVLSTTDGTKYYFGLNHLPGDSGSSASNSAWGVPVYNPSSGDPCNTAAQGQQSECTMGWRWNLDYVVDPDGNLTVYNYQQETNYYTRGYQPLQNQNGTLAKYVRGGFLTSISYGWLLQDAVKGDKAAAQVVFGSTQRCTGTGSQCDYSNLENGTDAQFWPDVPQDQMCGSSGTCTNYSPTYFSTYRLSSITTKVLEGSSYSDVDSYALAQTFPYGSGSSPVMFLDSIQRTGEDGTAVELPAETFVPQEIDNRVAGLVPYAPPVDRPRLWTITTETGAEIIVTFQSPECSRASGGTMPSAPDTNTMACFPVFWDPGSGVIKDWFTKSLVSQVVVHDLTGAASPDRATDYYYLGNAAWHQNTSPVVPSSKRTWDQYRGFQQVETATGDGNDPVTATVSTYMQGMNGDATALGGTKSVSVKDSLGDSYADDNWLAGHVLETDTYTHYVPPGTAGTVDAKTINVPGTYTQTASQSQPGGLPDLTAHMLQHAETRTLSLLASKAWRTSTTTSYYNNDAQVTAVDAAPAGSAETCTSTSYASAPTGNTMMEDYPDVVTEVTGAASGGACPAKSSANIVSATRTYYDDPGASLSSMGTLGSLTSPGGLATGVSKAATWPSGGSETWQPQSVTGYDEYGRLTSTTTPASSSGGDTTSTAFTPATGQLPTQAVVTNPMSWNTTTVLDQARQLPAQVTDPNGNVTTETYDALGRLTSVTTPLDQTASSTGGPVPTDLYSYSITGTSPSAVTTQTLRADGSYATDVKIYDGMLQLRQEQQTPQNAAAGRLITDTFYDSHGWVVKTSDPYYDDSPCPPTDPTNPPCPPDATLYIAQDSSVPGQTVTLYDGQGRVTASQFYSLGQLQWQTATAYPGMNETDTTPPAGGTATSVFTNALGQTTASWKYTTAAPDGNASDADVTSYTYTPAGSVATVADNAGNTWTYGYNLLGQKTSANDPGATAAAAYTYDSAGNLATATDPRNQTLAYTYDALNRKTGEYSGSVAPANEIASWTYDTLAKGQLTSSASYTAGASGPAYTEAVTGYNAAYEPAGTTTSIPSTNTTGPLAGQYSTISTYDPLTGLLQSIAYTSSDGGLPAETVSYSYNLQGLLRSFGGSTATNSFAYLDSDSYTAQGQILRTTFGNYGDQLVQTYNYDAGTTRLLTATTDLQPLSAAADTTNYTYNQAGDITSASDAQNTGDTQTQCYTYNNLQELTRAWTDSGGTTTAPGPSVEGIGGCTNTTPSAASIGGHAPYWESYTYDPLGDRTSEISHDTASQSQDITANETTQTISYPGGGTQPASQPDAATTITTAGPGGTVTTTPIYNAAGGTTSRTSSATGSTPPASPPAESKITYNPRGLTASVTTSGGTSSYVYDASGDLRLQADPSTTTLYLDDGTEQLVYTPGAKPAVTGLRFYDSPDGTVIVRSAVGSLSYETTDQQHTALEAIDASSLAVTRRYYDPYGNPVGRAPANWPDNNAYLGKPEDTSTSLDLLGVREYDPVTGAFLSLDPLLEAGSPTQMNGYAYAGDNPVTEADPTGQHVQCDPQQGGCGNYGDTDDGGSRTTSSGSGGPPSYTGPGDKGVPEYDGPGGPPTAAELALMMPHPKPLIKAYQTALHQFGKDLPPSVQYEILRNVCDNTGLCSQFVLARAEELAAQAQQSEQLAADARIAKYGRPIKGTVGGCFSFALGVVGGSVCLVLASSATQSQIGLTATFGGGTGVPSVDASVGVMVSNATQVTQQGGGFLDFGGGANVAGPVTAGGTVATGTDAQGQRIWDLTGSVGLGAEATFLPPWSYRGWITDTSTATLMRSSN